MCRYKYGTDTFGGSDHGNTSGDVDPAVLQFICNHEHISVDEMLNILNEVRSARIEWSIFGLRDVVKAAGEENERAKLALGSICISYC